VASRRTKIHNSLGVLSHSRDFFLFIKDFIYSFERERQREHKQGERQREREKQTPR